MPATLLTILLSAAFLLQAADQAPADTPRTLRTDRNAPLKLSLKRAVEIALSPEGNARIPTAEEEVIQAQSRSAQARSAMLPDLEGSLSDQSVIRSLGQLGLTKIPLPPTLKIPEIVGPYDVADIRSTGSETFDFSSIRRFQAARSGIRAAQAESQNTANAVATLVAKAYLAALRADASFEAVKADVALAQAVLAQAQNQKVVGTGTGIEITRAKVQLSNEKQRSLVAENDRRKARFELLRDLGMALDANIELTDTLSFIPMEAMTFEQAKTAAWASRDDLKAQQNHENSARLSASAVKYERLPSVTVFGDYGTTGQGVGSPLLPTRTYGASLRVPIFDGGRRDARRVEASSQYREEQLRTNDLRQQIELELREALDSLRSAQEQIDVAREGLTLADSELTQARRRFEAGVANGIEVTDAQTRLEHARDNQIAALFNYNLARIDLGQALGTVQQMTSLNATAAKPNVSDAVRPCGMPAVVGKEQVGATSGTNSNCGGSGALAWINSNVSNQ